MNYYEPKYLRGVLEKSLPVRMFFRNRFFSQTLTYPTETVSFEFAQDKRRLLPYTNSHIGSVPLEREGYQLKVFHPPLLSGARIITNDTLNQKLLGESEWNSEINPAERAEELALRDLDALQTALFRREEYMCAKLKQDGKIDVTGSGISGEIDYGFENISDESGNQWTDSYDVIGKLKEKATVLRKSGINPDMLIVGAKASMAIQNNKGILKLRHDQLMNVPEEVQRAEGGVNFVCRLRVPGLVADVYEYLEYYYDEDADESKPIVEDGTVIMQSSLERNMMLYGAVTYIGENDEYVSAMGRYVPYVVTEKDPPMKKLIVSSRPLPMPRDLESWYVMKNVA